MEILGNAPPRPGRLRRTVVPPIVSSICLIWVSFLIGASATSAHQQTQTPAQQPPITSGTQPAPQSAGNITGTVLDETGAAIAGAKIKLTRDDHSLTRDAVSDNNGQFTFADVAAGSFQLAITANGFAGQTSSGVVAPGEVHSIPPITLKVATEITQVRVGLSREEVIELAQEEIKQEEKQRVLGWIPNFYVTYIPDAAPLTPKQKFQLAFRSTIDPVTFLITGAASGIEQADGQFGGYGQGATGYGKRYGAAYADTVTETFIGGAILPSLLKQDPRYFYKGTGSVKSRFFYAIAFSVMCKGDDRRWEPNYSLIFGSMAAAGISNLYYPNNDRGAGLTFENTFLAIGSAAAANVIQEFVARKLTPNLPGNHTTKAANTVSQLWMSLAHEGH